MPTLNGLRKVLDRKQWEPCNYCPNNSGANSFITSSRADGHKFFALGSTTVALYDPNDDGWTYLPNPSMGGTFGGGSCGSAGLQGPAGTATGGSTTTIVTNLTLPQDLRGYKVRITAGPNAGQERTILKNTLGANSVITVDQAYGTAITSSSQYALLTGRFYFFNGGTLSATSFKYFDTATNTWVALAVTGLPGTFGTDAKLICTDSTTQYVAATNTLSTSTNQVGTGGKAWPINAWANMQVRIVAGTGAGQVRTIASSTGNTLTVSANWTIAVDTTSQYVIEGNDDYIYLLGNNSTAIYRYSLTSNTWTTLAPATARAAAPTNGMTANWINGVTAPDWLDETLPQGNGRYIYSFRGNNNTGLDIYDISLNTWTSQTYAPMNDAIGSTGCAESIGGFIYLMLGSGGRMIKFNIAANAMEPCSQLWYSQASAITGDRMFSHSYIDGGTRIDFLYYNTASQNMLFRMMLI